MKFGLNKQRVLFGLLVGALGLNATWFQQISNPINAAVLSSEDDETSCDLTQGNRCQLIKVIQKKEGDKVVGTKEIKYIYELERKTIVGKSILAEKAEDVKRTETEGVAIVIKRQDCPGCREVIPQAYTIEQAKNMGISLSKVAQDYIDKLAEREAENMKTEIEVEKKNKKKEAEDKKLAKEQENCDKDEDGKKISGHDKVFCLAEKIEGLEDEKARDKAFAVVGPRLRDALINGTPEQQARAQEILASLNASDSSKSITQTTAAMLAGYKYESQAEKLFARMSRTRRGSQEFQQLSSRLRTLARNFDKDLIQNAERAEGSGRATPASLGEADFWVGRLADDMKYALRSPQEAAESLRHLQGRDSGYSLAGDLDRLDRTGSRSLTRSGSRFDGGRSGSDRYLTAEEVGGRGSVAGFRGGSPVNRRYGRGGVPAYAQGRFNGRRDYTGLDDRFIDDDTYDYDYDQLYPARSGARFRSLN